jgi:nicotinamide-nucleotide amidase
MNKIGFLATGNELTEGDILNTNGQFMAQLLTQEGFVIGLHIIVPDDEKIIADSLDFLLLTHATIIVTGGLGPTSDDKTRQALSKVVQQPLVFDESTWQTIRTRIRNRLGHEPHSSNQQQALFPEGAVIMPNPHGTAAGCFIINYNKTIYMLPGPPKECIPMFEEYVLPNLLKTRESLPRRKISYQLKGVAESDIAARVDAALKAYPVSTGYRVNSPFIEVKIYGQYHDAWDEMVRMLENILQPYRI